MQACQGREIDHYGDCLNCGAHVAETCRGDWPAMPPRRPPSARTEAAWQRYVTAPDRGKWVEYLGVMWSPEEMTSILTARARHPSG